MANTPKWDDTQPIDTKDTLSNSASVAPSFEETEPYHAPDETTPGEAILTGAKQGTTLGFSDEAAGLLQQKLDEYQKAMSQMGLASPSPTEVNEQLTNQGFKGDIGPQSSLDLYRQVRDQERQKIDKAQKEQPAASLVGNVLGGSLLPGPAMVGKTAQFAEGFIPRMLQSARVGMGAGAAAGIGTSNDDYTKMTPEEQIEAEKQDVGAGGLQGGALGAGVSSLIDAVKSPVKVAGELYDIAKGNPVVQDFLKAKEFGKQGINVTGGKNFEKFGQEALDQSEDAAKSLALEGGKLATGQKEILQNSPETFDINPVLNKMQEEAGNVPKVGSLLNSDAEQLAKIPDQVKIEFGLNPTEKQNYGILNDQLKKMTPDDPNYGFYDAAKKQLEQKAEQSMANLPADEANRIKKMFTSLTNISKEGEVPELKTPQGQNVASTASQNIAKNMYEAIPDFAEQNKLITDYNNTMSNIGLNKVNQGNIDASDMKVLRQKVFDIVRDANRSTDASVSARNSINEINDILGRVNPELQKTMIPKLQDTASKYELAKQSVSSGNMMGKLMNIQGHAVTSGNMIGLAQNTLSKATPEVIKMMADKFSQAETATSQQLANMFNKMAEKGHTGRNAIIFGILQNPSYRQELGITKEMIDQLSKSGQDYITNTNDNLGQ